MGVYMTIPDPQHPVHTLIQLRGRESELWAELKKDSGSNSPDEQEPPKAADQATCDAQGQVAGEATELHDGTRAGPDLTIPSFAFETRACRHALFFFGGLAYAVFVECGIECGIECGVRA